jgi:hypothetical protein
LPDCSVLIYTVFSEFVRRGHAPNLGTAATISNGYSSVSSELAERGDTAA